VAHRDVHELEQRYDHAVARAVFAPEKWLEVAGSLVQRGTIWLMLTEKQLGNWTGGGKIIRYRVGGDRERALVAVRR
jgi:hypothetical protein